MTLNPSSALDPSWEYNIHWEKHGHTLLAEALLKTDLPLGTYIIEIGSDRGEGSTKILAEIAYSLQMEFVTVDVDPILCNSIKNILENISPFFEAVCSKGEEYLKTELKDNSIAALYLDAYDTMPPGLDLPQDMKEQYLVKIGPWNNQKAWDMHLESCKQANSKLIPGGLVCFDDMWRRDRKWAMRSKGYTAVPWLMSQGYEELDYVEGCVLLRKPKKED